jgi:hypothetical protein
MKQLNEVILFFMILLSADSVFCAEGLDHQQQPNAVYSPKEIESSAERQTRCQNVDARNHMSEQLQSHFKTAHNQGVKGDIGYCYALATTDILSYHAQQPVSATFHWVQYTKNLDFLDRSWRNLEALFNPDSQIFMRC